MRASDTPTIKDLVLVGGGHSHVAVLKGFGMRPLPGVQLTLIARDVHTPYSGMLPGLIAEHYGFDDVHLDLRRLARFAGARLVHAPAVGLDVEGRHVRLAGRPPVPYDVLSINIGSTPEMRVPGARDTATPVKPINTFIERWEALRSRVLAHVGRLRIGCVGAGAGGVEVLLAIAGRLRRDLAGVGRDAARLEFHLFTDSDEILPSHNRSTRRRFERILRDRDIDVHPRHRVVAVEPGRLKFEEAPDAAVDEILWVTPAGAAPWLRDTGLALDADGFITVDDTLRSTSHPDVFAVGDIAHMVNYPRPKAGVFAVRQGPPLAENLRRALVVGRALRRFVPQRAYLSIITTGDKHAVASRGAWAAEGDLIWRLKHWIDARWMRQYVELPEMTTPASEALPAGLADEDALQAVSALAMRCGGCGAKVGSTVLGRVLGQLQTVSANHVLVGLHEPDDAAVVDLPADEVVVQTVDFFRAFVDDPYVFGQIAANHALGDIFAMGARPRTALAIATVPYGLEAKVEEQLYQMMSGAVPVLDAAGTTLVGGHTSEGAELALGFSVTGTAAREAVLTKGGMRPGEQLVLTKPLGTGTLFAAEMRGKARGRWIEGAIAVMLQSNREAAECLGAYGASACTDVTGFGLLGHLLEMVRPSGVDVELELEALPLLEGALETTQDGIFSSLQPANVRLRRAIRQVELCAADPRYPFLFDPQTAGGLLASLPADRARDCLVELHRLGYARAAIIGGVRSATDTLEPISVHAGD